MRPNRGNAVSICISSINRAIVLLMVMIFSVSAEAAVEAALDRNRIIEGETVILSFQTDNAKQSLDADFSGLEGDFVILDRRSETQLSIVNGRQTAVVRLLLTLEPRKAGKLEISSFAFGQDRTSPISLQVDPAPVLEPGKQPPVFIEVEVTPGEGPYFVHAQLGLVVRVFYQQNLTEAAISQPDPSPASVRLMQETPYQAERGGERYRVLERNYAVFPERSGNLTIPPMQLSGRLVERRTGSVWQPTVRGRRVRVESDALHLVIEPKPDGFTGSAWQPARNLVLTQQVSTGDALQVGEPVTRTVIVDAIGLEENMILEPVWPELPNARIYPDQPQGITRDDGHWVLGHKEFRYAIVPEKAGELVLPELQVHWWDTKNNRQRTARLPEHRMSVKPSALVPPSPPAAIQGEPDAAGTIAPMASVSRGQPAYWRWLALLFAALWLLTLFAAWRLRGRAPAAEGRGELRSRNPENGAGLLGELKRACDAGDVIRARRALHQWLSEFGPVQGNGSLLEFAAGIGDEKLRDNIYALDSEGFRPNTGPDSAAASPDPWNGQLFWKRFETWRKDWLKSSMLNRPGVTDLYARENRIRA